MIQNLVQSLENLTETKNLPIPTSNVQNKQAPPVLPPRISSTSNSQQQVNYFATLPRNRKPNSRKNSEEKQSTNSQENNNGNLSIYSNLSSSATNSPIRHVANPSECCVDVTALLVPPTPPPMPLISLPTPNSIQNNSSSNQKTIKRTLPFSLPNESNTSTSANYSLIDRSTLYSKLNKSNTSLANGSVNVSNNKSVLSDLDSMLCDLNKQLDAMLDVEKAKQQVQI
jgi:hypothetical protein